MKKSVEELVYLACEGNQEAIAALYEQTYTSVYQSVRAIINDEDEALDIVQDSYIKGFQNLDKLGDPQKYQAWMKTIAANQARDFLRKKRPALFSERVDEDGEEIDLRHQDDCLDHMPEEVIDRQETTRLMNDILGVLSEEQRLAIVMFYYEERSVREIAEILSCSENTVKSRLNYGRKKIEAEVRALEKKGTKLYSLAPLPFFIWLLRMAKGYGITAEAVVQTSAVGVAGTAAAAGESAAVSAGSSASGSSAAGAAAKTAGTVAGKTLATKVIAGTLAVTMAAGAGAVAVSHQNREKENEAAHVIYEEFLDNYQAVFEMNHEEYLIEYHTFQNELAENISQLPYETMPNGHKQYALEYISGDFFSDGTPVPQVQFTPNMAYGFLWGYHDGAMSKGIEVVYAFQDVTGDGIDELFIKYYYIPEHTTEIVRGDLGVYTVNNGILRYGIVTACDTKGDILVEHPTMWTISGENTSGMGYEKFVIRISSGSDAFGKKLWKDDPRKISDEQWIHLFGDDNLDMMFQAQKDNS